MESKKRLRRTIIWKRRNRSKRIQWKRDANNNNNAEMGSSSKPLFLISTVSLVCRSWGRVCFDHLFGEDGDNTLDFTILNCDCCRRLFGSKVTLFKKAFLMKFLRGVMDVYRRDDDDDDDDVDDEDGIRVTLITRMVFPSGLLQLILYIAESTPSREETLDGLVLSQSVAFEDVSSTPREKEIKDELKEIWIAFFVLEMRPRGSSTRRFLI